MRTYRQELEIQVIEIFEEFYKEKIEKENSKEFTIVHEILEGMLSEEFKEDEEGFFYYDYYEVSWKLVIKNKKRSLNFERGGY